MTVWGRSDALHWKGIFVFHWSLSFLDLLFGIGRILDMFMQWWRSFAQGEEESVYSTRCNPYESSLCPCYTHIYLFLTARHCKSSRKDRTSALCCRGKTLAVNQDLVLACSYKNQSCFFLFEEGVACNLTLPGKEGHMRCLFVCFPVNTSERDDGWVMLSAQRNAVVFVGWALDGEFRFLLSYESQSVSAVGDAPINSAVCMRALVLTVLRTWNKKDVQYGSVTVCLVGWRYGMWANICVKMKLWNVLGMKGGV